MASLLDLMKALEEDDEEQVSIYACELLITDNGQCNWKAIRKLEIDSSCQVFALEKDSFGWLIGGIRYNGKVFSYG